MDVVVYALCKKLAAAAATGISNLYIDDNGHLICVLGDGTIIDAGETGGGGLIQIDTFANFPYPGKEGSLYLALDTKNAYFYNSADNMYERVVTNGVKDENLTAVETHTRPINFDGVNYTYDLPVNNVKVSVYVNGLYLTEGIDYTLDRNITPNQITFNELYETTDEGLMVWVIGKVESHEFATREEIDNLFPEEVNE